MQLELESDVLKVIQQVPGMKILSLPHAMTNHKIYDPHWATCWQPNLLYIYALLWPHTEWPVSLTGYSNIPQVDTYRVNPSSTGDFALLCLVCPNFLYACSLTIWQLLEYETLFLSFLGTTNLIWKNAWCMLQNGHCISQGSPETEPME